MELKEALQKLGIEEYEERILNSNSHGELHHVFQYFHLAETFKDKEWFAVWFRELVKQAEENWKRPESVFQHISTILEQHLSFLESKKP